MRQSTASLGHPRGGQSFPRKKMSSEIWNVDKGRLLATMEGHKAKVRDVTCCSATGAVVSGSDDSTMILWNLGRRCSSKVIEGHTGSVSSVSFSSDGRLLASASDDGTIRIWRTQTWETAAVITFAEEHGEPATVAFHPTKPLLAAARGTYVHLWAIDSEMLLAQQVAVGSLYRTTAKIVLLGHAGVGKTCLGWRLSHGEFGTHPSTHGQQFWVVDSLGTQRADGTQCEAVLWDLAGQPDYRLIHSLFIDDADLALVLFDASTHDLLERLIIG